MAAIFKGMEAAGVPNNTALIFSELMDAKSLFLTANADTVYFWVNLDVSKGPIVVETPPLALGVIDDMWFNWITDFGLPGPDRGEGGKYLLLPPGYKGEVPDGGYFVQGMRTTRATLLGRSFLEKDDPKPVVALIKKTLKVYPYLPGGYGTSIGSALEGKATLARTPDHKLDWEFLRPEEPVKFTEGTGKVMNTVPPSDFSYFEMLNDVVQKEPVGALDPEIMGSLAAIGIVKGKPFNPDARMKKILTDAAAIGNAAARTLARQIRVIDQLEAAFAAPLTRRRVRSVLRIVDKGLDCFRRWKLQKCNKGGIKRLALQRLYVPAACQVLASVFVHNVVHRSRVFRHPTIVRHLDVCDQVNRHCCISRTGSPLRRAENETMRQSAARCKSNVRIRYCPRAIRGRRDGAV